MKTLSTLSLALGALLVTGSAIYADTNIAPAGAGFGGSGLFGYNNTGNPLVLGTTYDHAGSSTVLNDGNTSGGSDDTFGQSNPSLGFAGISFSSPVTTLQINSVNFYGSLFGDGGWFGTNGVGPLGAGSTLTASNLIAPTLQVTYNGGVSWVNVPTTNNYVTAMTGAFAGGAADTPETTFTLTSAVTGIDGIRLIGQDGGFASGGGGFLGGKEFQVEAGIITAPEPSTWAMMLAGLAFLGFSLRRKRERALCRIR